MVRAMMHASDFLPPPPITVDGGGKGVNLNISNGIYLVFSPIQG